MVAEKIEVIVEKVGGFAPADAIKAMRQYSMSGNSEGNRQTLVLPEELQTVVGAITAVGIQVEDVEAAILNGKVLEEMAGVPMKDRDVLVLHTKDNDSETNYVREIAHYQEEIETYCQLILDAGEQIKRASEQLLEGIDDEKNEQ